MERSGRGRAGCSRIGMQFHWENDGYADFEGFLGALSSRKRKVLRRERRDANAAGLTFHALSGADITERHWDAFYAFYQSTVDRKWGSAYLTRSFFSLLGQRLGDRVVLMYAENGGKPVAGALNLAGDEALYGRNWGCRGDWPFLHFELCYYRAIDWAIEHGLKRVEAGAQGRHKIQRGYLPKPTYSAHWITHTGLRRAVANFLVEERAGIEAEMAGARRGVAVPQGRGLTDAANSRLSNRRHNRAPDGSAATFGRVWRDRLKAPSFWLLRSADRLFGCILCPRGYLHVFDLMAAPNSRLATPPSSRSQRPDSAVTLRIGKFAIVLDTA